MTDHDPRKSPSTKKQRQLIAIGCAQLGIDADTRHEMLGERFGVASTTLITRYQAYTFLEELRGRGFVIRSRVKAPRSRKGRTGVRRKPGAPVLNLVTQGELDKIQAVAGLIGWRFADGLERWMKKRMGIDRVRTSEEAYRVIEGLKKMFENHMKATWGAQWWVLVYENPAIEHYKTEHCPVKLRAMMMARRQEAEKMASRKGAKNAKKGENSEGIKL